MKKILSVQSGFTLVEVLVAISLLLMVIVGPLQIISRTNNSTAFATEQMTAWLLAQEGLELAQQARDGHMLQYFEDSSTYSDPWTRFKNDSDLDPCFDAEGCGLVIRNNGTLVVTRCTGILCLLYNTVSENSANGRASYQHAVNDTPSPFTRVVTMRETAGHEVLVTSTVTWRTGSLITGQKVVTSTYLFNIYDTP